MSLRKLILSGTEDHRGIHLVPQRPTEDHRVFMNHDLITEQILRSSYKIHSSLGPGLLESAYQACLKYELEKEGLMVETEKQLPLIYEEVKLDCGYRLDILVENSVIVELKTVESFTEVHLAQMLTYLRLANKKVGLLINFNTKSLKNGIKRISL